MGDGLPHPRLHRYGGRSGRGPADLPEGEVAAGIPRPGRGRPWPVLTAGHRGDGSGRRTGPAVVFLGAGRDARPEPRPPRSVGSDRPAAERQLGTVGPARPVERAGTAAPAARPAAAMDPDGTGFRRLGLPVRVERLEAAYGDPAARRIRTR